MQNSNSIDAITTVKPATSLDAPPAQKFDADKFFQCIQEIIPFELRKYFDLGFNFYKTSNNDDITFLKNVMHLFVNFYSNILKDTTVEVEKQQAMIQSLEAIFKNFENNLSIHNNLVTALKIDKKVFDARKLFMIIIGYGISNIKKSS